MAWSSPGSLPTSVLSGTPFAIIVTLLVALSLPLLLHFYLYRSAVSTTSSPTFLLLGPSSSGKTSFLTLLERTSTKSLSPQPPTRTSQTPITVPITLQNAIPIGSARFRSENDSSLQSTQHRQFALIDTPGHGKLRSQHGLLLLSPPETKKDQTPPIQNVKGVIFFADSAFPSGDPQIRDTAEYLHDILLLLQKRAHANPKGRRRKGETTITNVLIAANKQDLFTALPPTTIKSKLEKEIDVVRKTRARGLMTAGTEGDDEEEKESLGRDEGFTFMTFEDDTGMRVEVVGGSARGEEGAGVRRWEEWIGGCL